MNEHTINRRASACDRTTIPFSDYLETQNLRHPGLDQGELYARLNRRQVDLQSPPTQGDSMTTPPSHQGLPKIGEISPTRPEETQRTLQVIYQVTHPIRPGLRIDQVV